jgi:hypothetical protein
MASSSAYDVIEGGETEVPREESEEEVVEPKILESRSGMVNPYAYKSWIGFFRNAALYRLEVVDPHRAAQLRATECPSNQLGNLYLQSLDYPQIRGHNFLTPHDVMILSGVTGVPQIDYATGRTYVPPRPMTPEEIGRFCRAPPPQLVHPSWLKVTIISDSALVFKSSGGKYLDWPSVLGAGLSMNPMDVKFVNLWAKQGRKSQTRPKGSRSWMKSIGQTL